MFVCQVNTLKFEEKLGAGGRKRTEEKAVMPIESIWLANLRQLSIQNCSLAVLMTVMRLVSDIILTTQNVLRLSGYAKSIMKPSITKKFGGAISKGATENIMLLGFATYISKGTLGERSNPCLTLSMIEG